MILDIAIKERLEQCADIFPALGIECIKAYAGVNSNILHPWTIMERLPGDNLHNIMLGAGNNLYQAIYAVSFKSEEDMKLIGSSNFEELIDAWGEFANNYCGMLMDRSLFTDNFGFLTQSMPQYSSGNVFYSKAYAFSGSLLVEEKYEINMGFAIRKLLV
ncbi:MAG TPA: hypothetical protein VHO70_09290 [Chitinispirillaceae bacterium]|nr:hypothetical protein [Chitinispirillaceae bacterium]